MIAKSHDEAMKCLTLAKKLKQRRVYSFDDVCFPFFVLFLVSKDGDYGMMHVLLNTYVLMYLYLKIMCSSIVNYVATCSLCLLCQRLSIFLISG